MKKSTIVVALGVAALIMNGCGGGSDSSTNSSTNHTNNSGTNNQGTQISRLTLQKADDLRGYTLQTNKGKTGPNSPISSQITVSIGCDGKFTYQAKSWYNGTASDPSEATGDKVTLDFDAIRLEGHYTKDDSNNNKGDTFDEHVYDLSTGELVTGSTCFFDFGESKSGSNCPNGLYLEKIIQDHKECGGGSSTVTDNPNESMHTTAKGLQSISSEELEGYTIVSEYKSGTKVLNIKKVNYIFLEGEQAMVVIDLFDGSKKVLRADVYKHNDGNHVAIMPGDFTWDNDDKITLFAPLIGTENGYDKITVGHSTAHPYTVTAILSNDENGIDEATVTATHNSSSDNSAVPTKNVSIYNNIDVATAFGNSNYLATSSSHVEERTTPFHCTSYGFKDADLISESDDSSLHTHSRSYSHGGYMCIEVDYANSSASGNKSYLTY